MLKKFLVFLVILVPVWTSTIFCQYIYDNASQLVRKVESGYYCDGSGTRLGYSTKDGDIFNSNAQRIGYHDGNNYYDNTGNRVGYIDGKYLYNNSQQLVAYIEDDMIYANAGAFLGRIDGMKTALVRILIFYWPWFK